MSFCVPSAAEEDNDEKDDKDSTFPSMIDQIFKSS